MNNLSRNKIISFTLILTYLLVFVVQDVSFAMSSGSTDASSGAGKDAIESSAVQSFQPDLFTGRAATSIPIFVPPGRKGLQPSIALSYSSGGGNGWLGVGWMFDLGVIQRSTKNGVASYTKNEFFFSFQGVNSELVDIGDGEYRAKDEGAFLKFKYNDTSWEVWDKSGTGYKFGTNESSQLVTSVGTFQWQLDRITDTNGNYLEVSYIKNNDQIYPSQVKYTGNEKTGDLPFNTVDFILEDRNDVILSSISGEEIKTAKLLKEIVVKVSGSLSRRYELIYKLSRRTHRSLLSEVRQFGTDSSTSLPPMKFSYQDHDDLSYNITSNLYKSSGDNHWSVRVAEGDYFSVNESVLSPDGRFVGVVGNGTGNGMTVTFGKPHISASGAEAGMTWSTDPNGSLHIEANGPDKHFHALTYVYSAVPKEIYIENNSRNCIWLARCNGKDVVGYSFDNKPQQFNLNKGYNLIEYTGYNQEGSFTFDLNYPLAYNVDMMNSSVFIVPQLAGDFNGDGMTDLALFSPEEGNFSVSLSCSVGFGRPEVWIEGFGSRESVPLLGDYNLDGNTDICIFNKDTGSWKMALSDGEKSFQAKGEYISNFGKGQSAIAGDFNGDGRIDVGSFDKTTGTWQVALANESGTNFASGSVWLTNFGKDLEPMTGDFNADGLTDILAIDKDAGKWEVALCNGSKFIASSTNPWATGFGAGKEPLAIDYNGDGITDIGYFDKPNGLVKVMRCDGYSKFLDEKVWLDDFTLKEQEATFQPGEFNGDGLIDPAVFNHFTNMAEIAFSQGKAADLLSGMDNGIGGGTTIIYRPYHPAPDVGDQGLPFILPVINEVITSDGMGNSYTQRYAFEEGLFDWDEKEFRGFRRAFVFDKEQNSVETTFLQDDIFKGRMEEQKTKDAEGKLYSRSRTKWENVNPYPDVSGVNFVYLSEQDNFVFDGDETNRHTSSSFEYDTYGNITRTIEQGEVEAIGDERTSVNEYTYNTDAHILNTLCRSTLYEGTAPTGTPTGTKLSERFFYYDNNTALKGTPTKGNLFKEEKWLDGGKNPTITMTYDDYGNVETITDALEQVTTNKYDSTNHAYVESITNALGHTSSFTYDYLTGQVLTTTDPNGAKSRNVYDKLGRLIEAYSPLDPDGEPQASYEYDLSKVPNMTISKSRERVGEAKEIVTYTFTDGLGRTIQTRVPAEEQNKQIIMGGVVFNKRGQIKYQITPYFEDFSDEYVAPTLDGEGVPVKPHLSFEYDSVGRRVKTTYADGTYSQTLYSDWDQTQIDPNGHKTEYFNGAYGRLIKVKEYNREETYSTGYYYDLLGNLIKTIDDLGNTTQIQYDTLSRKISMDDPDMGAWKYTYDVNNNLLTQTDAKNQSITFEYDILNRLTKKSSLRGTEGAEAISYEVHYTYDERTVPYSKGRLTKVNDQSGTTEFQYDILGRTIQETKSISGDRGHFPSIENMESLESVPSSYTFTRTYDALGRLTTLTYPDEETIRYTYNNQGDVEKITSMTGTEYVQNVNYNPSGQLTRLDYGNGTYTDYTYNPQTLRLQNLITKNNTNQTLQDFTYTFDKVGNISRIEDKVHTATQDFLYDDLDRLVLSASDSYGVIDYRYNSIGNMLEKGNVTYTYGQEGTKPHAVTAGSDGFSAKYDANGNMIEKLTSDGQRQALIYDAENRLNEVKKEVGEMAEVSISLAPGWNFISLPLVPQGTLSEGKCPLPEALKGLTFGTDYNQISRYNPDTQEFEHYVGDPEFNDFDTLEIGRGYQLHITNPNGVTLTFTGTQYTSSLRGTEGAEAISLHAGYNLISIPTTVPVPIREVLDELKFGLDYDKILTYNNPASLRGTEGAEAISELTTLDPATGTFEPGRSYYIHCLKDTELQLPYSSTKFIYDGDGGRVHKLTPSSLTTYLGQSYELTNLTNSTNQTNLTTKHIFLGSTRICTVTKDEGRGTRDESYYHTDHLGSSNIITDETGQRTQLLEYTPYGETWRSEGSTEVTHKFTGQELDASTGLYYYNARYYDPSIGRFSQADTVVTRPYDPQDLNRYAYCRNNPIKYIDPSGHGWFSKFFEKHGSYFGLIGSFINACNSGDWNKFGKELVITAIAVAANMMLPGAGTLSSNFLLNVGLHVARGAAIGAVTGGISAEIMGGEFSEGAKFGAITGGAFGAIQGVATSQQFQNWRSGKGFLSDSQVQAKQKAATNIQKTLDNAQAEGGIEARAEAANEVVNKAGESPEPQDTRGIMSQSSSVSEVSHEASLDVSPKPKADFIPDKDRVYNIITHGQKELLKQDRTVPNYPNGSDIPSMEDFFYHWFLQGGF